ncbi:nuclear transport factor 2 family protein [Candidatus Phycosocius spiralis]|uniref:DUF4440 domain-containing protein n=1 Tax=Candidatus Phycosocius spiralis TaxID=2815099 RepID=A0ABQ4PY83_9PROT|nr:nuclear transport factor 2 family protein [Candidatus Phycosocius spiralis]GIU67930.1 hypothetical protein PsB1_2084 [Candidatus Phycosocius spiralis]
MSSFRFVVCAVLISFLGLMPQAVAAQTSPPEVAQVSSAKPEWRRNDPASKDESEDLLGADRAFAATLAVQGPLAAYQEVISPQGILHDASGASPEGSAGVKARFASFPADVSFEREPEGVLASNGTGSTWGRYVIKKGDKSLSVGRYISVWRREEGIWRLLTELAAGRPSQQAATAVGPLPRRPPTAGQSPDQSATPASTKP